MSAETPEPIRSGVPIYELAQPSSPPDPPPSPPSPHVAPPPTDDSALFSAKVQALQLDAIMKASRAREYAAEWMLGGLVCSVLYLLFIVIPRAGIQFIDVIVIVTTAGGGLVMLRHERNRGADLMQLARDFDQAVRPE